MWTSRVWVFAALFSARPKAKTRNLYASQLHCSIPEVEKFRCESQDYIASCWLLGAVSQKSRSREVLFHVWRLLLNVRRCNFSTLKVCCTSEDCHKHARRQSFLDHHIPSIPSSPFGGPNWRERSARCFISGLIYSAFEFTIHWYPGETTRI